MLTPRSDTDWDINWADVGWIRDFYDHIHLDDHQRLNHFRNHYELTRKGARLARGRAPSRAAADVAGEPPLAAL